VILAHVKWFSDFSFAESPRTLGEVLTPTFLALLGLSVLVIVALVPVDSWLEKQRWYCRVNEWLRARAGQSRLVMRIGAGMVLLLAWQADLVLVPDLPAPAPWIGWLEFVIAALLLFEATTAYAGVGLLVLYGLGVAQAGLYYMLDYVLVVGVAYYLIVTGVPERKISGSSIPALYLTVGFSLCWVALEKMVWPEWGLYILQENPQLSLGLDVDFFLLAAAFVEFCLGYLLIINLLQRPMALVVTLTFFLTTLVFGKVEVIGHTLIHAALVVFLLEGPGTTFRPPIALHRKLGLRAAFAGVNLLVLLAVLLPAYALGAMAMHRRATAAGGGESALVTSSAASPAPTDPATERAPLSQSGHQAFTIAFIGAVGRRSLQRTISTPSARRATRKASNRSTDASRIAPPISGGADQSARTVW
jgi:hypothetical protein